MYVAANSVIYPQRIVTNDDVCRIIHSKSSGMSKKDIETALGHIELYLMRLGAKHRRWLTASENVFSLINQAFLTSLEKAKIDLSEIDTVIYCGVDRGFLEPSNAAALSSQLGLRKVRAFDVVHACQGWFTALQIAGDRADRYEETTVILTAEFPMTQGGVAMPGNFNISADPSRKWNMASYVLGEAAASTIIRPGGSPLRYKQINDNDGYRASYVRLPQTERFLSDSSENFEAPELTFYSNSDLLTNHGMNIAVEAFDEFRGNATDNITVIPHTVSSRLVRFINKKYKNKFATIDIFPDYGNIGTSSMPAGLQVYKMDSKIHAEGRDQKAVGWMLAAGMSAAIFEFPLAR